VVDIAQLSVVRCVHRTTTRAPMRCGVINVSWCGCPSRLLLSSNKPAH